MKGQLFLLSWEGIWEELRLYPCFVEMETEALEVRPSARSQRPGVLQAGLQAGKIGFLAVAWGMREEAEHLRAPQCCGQVKGQYVRFDH